MDIKLNFKASETQFVKAYVTITLDDLFVIHAKIKTGKYGDFLDFPSYKGKDEKYHNYVYLLKKGKNFSDYVIKEFNQTAGEILSKPEEEWGF